MHIILYTCTIAPTNTFVFDRFCELGIYVMSAFPIKTCHVSMTPHKTSDKDVVDPYKYMPTSVHVYDKNIQTPNGIYSF